MKSAPLVLVLLVAAAARADDLRSELAQKHVAFAKELTYQGFFGEARGELLRALELDPDQKDARFALGYKREGAEWKGQPAPPRKDRGEWDGGHPAARRSNLHRQAAVRLAEAAALAKTNGHEEVAHALAGLALDEDPECRKARDLLGHENSGKNDHLGRAIYVSVREKAVRDVFGHAADAAKTDEPQPTKGDEALEELLGMGELDRRESEHAIYLATKASKADLPALARYVDTIRHAWSDLLPDDGVAPNASRVGVKVRWVVVAPEEHEAFVTKAILDPARRTLAKQLRSWSGWTLAGPRSPDGGAAGDQEAIFVYESSLPAENRSEWMALTAVKTLIQQRLPAKAPPPGFLVEGLGRFFAGRATGRIDMSFLSSKVSLSVHERTAWGWDELHASVRDGLSLSLEGDLRRLVSKSLNDLEDSDSELALAFLEYLLARRPKELSKLVSALSPDEPALATLERVTGSKVEGLERELRAWAREEY